MTNTSKNTADQVASMASSKTTSKQVMQVVGPQKGKLFLITGGYGGLGAETTKDLLEHGARVVVACRNADKMHKFRAAVVEQLGEKAGNRLEYLNCDVSDLESVKECANEFLKQHTSLDVLICNSGVMFGPGRASKQGFEYQFATNTLGHFLLTELLIGALKRSPSGGRVVHVSSVAYKIFGRESFDYKTYSKGFDEEAANSYVPVVAYQQSKVAAIELTRETAKRYGIQAVAVHPGVISGTELMRDSSIMSFAYYAFKTGSVMSLLCEGMKSVEQGAATTTACATMDHVENGAYYSNCKVAKLAPHVLDDEHNKEVFDACLSMCENYL